MKINLQGELELRGVNSLIIPDELWDRVYEAVEEEEHDVIVDKTDEIIDSVIESYGLREFKF